MVSGMRSALRVLRRLPGSLEAVLLAFLHARVAREETGLAKRQSRPIGIGREQWMLVAAALTLGGSIRVGLEDNFYLPDGQMARSNGDLIAQARRMTEEVGRRPATVEEARALLGIRPRVAT